MWLSQSVSDPSSILSVGESSESDCIHCIENTRSNRLGGTKSDSLNVTHVDHVEPICIKSIHSAFSFLFFQCMLIWLHFWISAVCLDIETWPSVWPFTRFSATIFGLCSIKLSIQIVRPWHGESISFRSSSIFHPGFMVWSAWERKSARLPYRTQSCYFRTSEL